MSAGKQFPSMKKNVSDVAQKGGSPEVSSGKDSELANGQHSRTYNPVDSAVRGQVSGALNSDAARFKKGPGPY